MKRENNQIPELDFNMQAGNTKNNKQEVIPQETGSPGNNSEDKHKKRKTWKIVLIIIGIILLILVLGLFIFYSLFLFQLPDVSNLRGKASQFETMRIYDKNGGLLYEIVPPEAGRRDYVTIDRISPYALATVIAVEDQDYYSHPGFDIAAIIRAVFQNAESNETVSGASTITQQLARNLLLSQDERYERTYSRKIKEIVLATEINRRYSKDEILEIYLNENYYGEHAYGIEAAAQTYFHTSAQNLNFAQAAFLAGLPQAPGYYDPHSNREATLGRFQTVLLLSYNLAAERGCISVRSGAECVRIDPLMVSNAVSTIEAYDFPEGNFDIRYPQWVNYVYTILEKQYGADSLYRSGFSVYTTLDPDIQDMVQEQVRSQIDSLAGLNVHNGAAVVMDPKTGDILAMVGSPDFSDSEHSGQVNMAISPRQPGSAIKPLIYTAAFEKGWTPATVIWDVETDFSPTGKAEDLRYSPPYHPVNYDGTFHGPVLARQALASSLNIPAVKALQYVGIYDDPRTGKNDGFISFAKRLHVDSLDKAGYGLSIALGGGEVTLLELTNAYSAFANNGRYVPSRAILRIENHKGEVIFSAGEPFYEDVIRPEYAYQISSILSDDSARALGFGYNSILNVNFPAAVKTGTTNDYRDNWTIGYNSNLLVGVWVGNADNQPMIQSTGVSGAAPIWRNVMEGAAGFRPDVRSGAFVRPNNMIDAYICSLTGTLPDQNCRQVKLESFANDQPPAAPQDGFIRQVMLDTWSGKIASAECSQHAELKTVLAVQEPEVIYWVKGTAQGRQWAEQNDLKDLDVLTTDEVLVPPCGYPALDLISPADNVVIDDDVIDIIVTGYAETPDLRISVEFTEGPGTGDWKIIRNDIMMQSYTPVKAAEWYVGDLQPGEYLIKVRMGRDGGTYYEVIHHVFINHELDFEYDDDFDNYFSYIDDPQPFYEYSDEYGTPDYFLPDQPEEEFYFHDEP